jgi:hypothetical protein
VLGLISQPSAIWGPKAPLYFQRFGIYRLFTPNHLILRLLYASYLLLLYSFTLVVKKP